MNCKPGDLAIIVGAVLEPNKGRIVLVERKYARGEVLPQHTRPYNGDGWVVFGFGRPLSTPRGVLVDRRAVADANLRPIRDPGDDAQDEMLRPLPQQDKVPA